MSKLATHALNSSPSKAAVSFKGPERFLPPVPSPCLQGYYPLPSTKSPRTCSFGCSARPSIIRTDRSSLSPSPQRYNIPSDFDTRKRGFSFGVGRQKIKGGPNDQSLSQKGPGPGAYKPKDIEEGVKVSLSPRIEDKSNKFQLSVPGPGSYEPVPATTKDGRYAISKFRNSLCPSIRNYKTIDVTRHENKVSPGAYQAVKAMDAQGHYFLSRFKSSRVRQFGRERRPDLVPGSARGIPGPGAYSHFSEFGAS